MLPQWSDTHPPCLQQLTQPHPCPLPPILPLLPSPARASILLLPLAGRCARVSDAEGERGSRGRGAIGRRGWVLALAQSSIPVGRCLVLFLLLIGRQQYLDRARLFTGGHKRGSASVSRQQDRKNKAALTSGELLHRGKVTTAHQVNKNTHTHKLTYIPNKQPCASITEISQPCCL